MSQKQRSRSRVPRFLQMLPKPMSHAGAARQTRTRSRAAAQTGPLRQTTVAGHTFVRIPGGTFRTREGKSHQVAPFFMGRTEVTQAQFAAYIKATRPLSTPRCWVRPFKDGWSHGPKTWRFPHKGDKHPVVCLTRRDARRFAAWLSRKTGRRIRLPTSAEWEWAARSGDRAHRYSWGNWWPPYRGAANIADMKTRKLIYTEGELSRHRRGQRAYLAGYKDGYLFSAPVGRFKPNTFGLHDMTGNVYEWVSDACAVRGGSFDNAAEALRTSHVKRVPCFGRFSAVGFRLVLEIRADP